jgi:hypothetical protein
MPEGIYFVRADGSGLRWLAPPAGNPVIILGPSGFVQSDNTFLAVDPSGRLLAVTGVGPGPDGTPALQIFLVDIASGARTQLTRLAATAAPCCVLFGANRTIFYYDEAVHSAFSVRTDGTGLGPIPPIDALPGAALVRQFAIAGDGAVFLSVPLDGTPKQMYANASRIQEVFRIEGHRVLQLTSFGQSDTVQVEPTRGGVQFGSSADPFGENPDGVCQLFAIDSLGGHLRQLTHFPYDHRPKNGCLLLADASCTINGDVWDRRTGMVGVVSSCDALGRNPDGEQVFTMRPDGSRIRQITSFRGIEKFPDGSVRVELGGPYGYSAPLF